MELDVTPFAIYETMCIVVCGDVLYDILQLLFKGERPIEKHILDNLEPALQGFNVEQKYTLQLVAKGKTPLRYQSVGTLFRLIQRTCGLADLKADIWQGKGKLSKKNIVEHYLLRIERIWSDIYRNYVSYLKIANRGFYQKRIKQLLQLLQLLISNVAINVQLPIDQLYGLKKVVDDHIQGLTKSFDLSTAKQSTGKGSGNQLVTPPISPEEMLDSLNLRLRQEEWEEEIYIAKWNASLPILKSEGSWSAYPFLTDKKNT